MARLARATYTGIPPAQVARTGRAMVRYNHLAAGKSVCLGEEVILP